LLEVELEQFQFAIHHYTMAEDQVPLFLRLILKLSPSESHMFKTVFQELALPRSG